MSCRRCYAVVFALGAFSQGAFSDEVVLLNGDRVTGRVVRKESATLTLATEYAGEVRIQSDKVQSLQTDAPVRLMRRDSGDVVTARLVAGDPRAVRLIGKDDQETGVVGLDQIAYINPSADQSGEGAVYKGRINLALSATRGNSNSSQAYGETELELHAVAKKYRYSLGLRGERREDAHNTTASNWLAKGDIDRFVGPGRFIYGRSSFEHDSFKDIRLRSTVGGGYGLQLIENEDTSLSVRGGLDYVSKDFIVAPDDDYPALGWGIKYAHWVFQHKAELFHEQEGFWNLTDSSDVTVRTRSGLRVPITNSLNANAQLNVDWEGKPAERHKATDSTLLFGLGYAW